MLLLPNRVACQYCLFTKEISSFIYKPKLLALMHWVDGQYRLVYPVLGSPPGACQPKFKVVGSLRIFRNVLNYLV